MQLETYDVEILSLVEKESIKCKWPWVQIKAYCDELGPIDIHYYPWENKREKQTIEVKEKYIIDLIKHEKEKYYHLDRIRAQII